MPILAPGFPEANCAAVVAIVLLGLIASHAWAQEQTAPAEPPPAAIACASARAAAPAPLAIRAVISRPGLIDKLGDWLRDSADGVSSGLKDTQQRIDDFNKGTLDTLTSIPIAGFASGVRCARARPTARPTAMPRPKSSARKRATRRAAASTPNRRKPATRASICRAISASPATAGPTHSLPAPPASSSRAALRRHDVHHRTIAAGALA